VQADLFAFGMGRALVWGWSIPRKLRVPGWLQGEAVVVLAGMGLSTPRFGGRCSARAARPVTDGLHSAACAHHDGYRRRATVRSFGAWAGAGSASAGRVGSRPSACSRDMSRLCAGLPTMKSPSRGGCLLSLVVVGVSSGMLEQRWPASSIRSPALRRTGTSAPQAKAAGSAAREDAHVATT
jgi:hypothetical protein